MLISFVLSAQTQISGIINDYSKVTAVDVPCNYVTASNPEFFAVGDKVLLIQMKGATIVETEGTTYGDLSGGGIGSAGNYEFNEVIYIDVNKLYLKETIRGYNPSGLVQIIRVPQYTNVEIVATLTALPWNGDIGGVLVFEAGDIIMNADIDVSSLGFRKGIKGINGGDCGIAQSFSQKNKYAYSLSVAADNASGKGEGATVATLNAGRGKQLNGGGGGNNHNNGGGGGGNYGNGGNGGNKSSGCYSGYGSYPGIGGSALSTQYAAGKIFLGGGGGAGQENNFVGQEAGNGAGIVIITANVIAGNGHKIMANGQFGGVVLDNANRAIDNYGDGAGGGGAGGVIFLNTINSNIFSLTAEAKGAQGSFSCYLDRNFGPGGGGGGGIIWIKDVTYPASSALNTDVSGGASGLSTGMASGATNYGAAAGSAGGKLTGLSLFQNSDFNFDVACGVPLPISLLNYSASTSGSSVDLNWTILSDDEKYFIIERSADAQYYQQVATVPATPSTYYSYKDLMPYSGISYYRLSYVNKDGRRIQLGVRRVNLLNAGHKLTLIPNPASTEVFVEALEETATIKLFTVSGQEVLYSVLTPGKSFSVEGLTTGMYILNITGASVSENHRLVVQ